MNRSVRLAALALVLLVVPVAACGDDDDAGAPGQVTTTEPPGQMLPGDEEVSVTVEGAWARTSPAMATNGAVYMEITASGDDRLVGAGVADDLAAVAEVHETSMDPDSGEMAMRETDSIELPAGETVVLEPGGYHIMLVDLVEPLEPGTTIEVTLTFEEAGEVVVVAEVRDMADGMHGG